MVEFCLTLFLSFPGCSHPGLVGVLPLSGLTAPVWSPGLFWLLGAGNRLASPLRLLAPSFSGVGACGRQSPPCFLTWCGALWLMALRSRHCRITAGLASMDMPLLVSSVESQLWGFCSWLYRASWLAQGCIPLLRLLPYFLRSEAEFLRVLCFEFRTKSLRWGHPSGSSLSQSSIGTKTLPPPSWCMVRVFAMGSPCRVGVCPRFRSERRLFGAPSLVVGV